MRRRPEGTTNTALVSGEIEVLCQKLTILNPSVPIPFQLDDDNLSETTRLTHRVLDLRRPAMQKNMMLRYRVTMAVRKYFDAAGFIDIETPMLTRSTPEGARDYLVPSRVHPGAFFALPQSPQLFKQLLMVAGFDRYYQIVKCFRDEDLRADRQPEFTQIDIETSFLTSVRSATMMEQMIRVVFDEVLSVKLPQPFPVITYADAMRLYGSDKPDLRIDLELTDLTDVMRDVEFKVFKSATEMKDGKVFALRIPGGGDLTALARSTAIRSSSRSMAPRGLAYIKVNQVAQGRAGLAKPDHQEPARCGAERRSSAPGEGRRPDFFLVPTARRSSMTHWVRCASRSGTANSAARAGCRRKAWQPLWVVDFPMFEFDEEAQRYVAAHHPFTSPKDGHEDHLATDPAQALAKAYDMVLNGWEMGGGSIRIHSEDVQSKEFRALKISAEEAGAKFGFLLDALQYGAPPHGGIAFGLDRLVAMMAGAESIRDVIAFPKTQRAQDLLTEAPSEVDEKQLRELHIRVRSEAKAAEPRVAYKRAQDRMKIPESVLVVIYTPALDTLIIERADQPGFWQSVTGSKAALDEPLRTVCA